MEKLSFKLEIFEGPLDLLLHLIDKDKIDIFDIPIASVLEQYMEYVDAYSQYNPDSIADFITMASTLMLIKSRMLLPRTEEEEDPRAELVDMLVEYKRYKKAAEELRKTVGFMNSRMVREPQPFEYEKIFSGTIETAELTEAYATALRRAKYKLPPPPETFTAYVSTKIVSVASRVSHVMKRLLQRGRVKFSALFIEARSRSEIVATFLAVLELAKSNRLEIKESSDEDVDLIIGKETEVPPYDGE